MLRDLKGTDDIGILLKKVVHRKGNSLERYVNTDYATNLDNKRSQTGFVFTLFGIAISSKLSLQHVVALSIIETKFMVVTEVVKEGIWLLGLIVEFKVVQKFVEIRCDNQNYIL